MEWQLEPVYLAEVVGHAVQANRSLFEGKGIALAAEGREPGPRVLADRDKIIQVVTNLLSNAAKFTPVGGRVAVRTFEMDARAAVEVEDTGPGIAPDQLEAIFERFRQVGDTLTSKPEGAGLGLPISREIAQAHGGSLTATSGSGKGSCFRLTLPILV
jgi:signal transduction histidine kinase